MALSPAALMATNQGNRTDWLNNSLSNRNLIINGAMQVAQRATSSAASTGYKSLDRFRWTGSGHASMAGSLAQVDVTDLAGFSKCLKYTVTTEEASISANEYWWMHTRIEAQDLQHLNYGTSDAKTCTLSFYVRCNVAGTYAVSIQKPDSTDQIFGSTYTISTTQANNSTTASGWQRVSITIPANTTQGIANDNGIGFDIRWILFAGSNYTSTNNTIWVDTSNGGYAYGHNTTMGTIDNSTWEITGVQLELGNEATSFEHKNYGDELAKCQRYFQMIAEGNGSPINVGIRYESNVYCYVDHPVTMRANPTIYASNASSHFRILMTGAGYTYSTPTAFLDQNVHRTQIRFGSFSGGSDGNGCWVQTNHADAYFGLNAEL